MSDRFIRRILLTEEKIRDKEAMAAFMKDALMLPDYFGGNLDALSDLLSEIDTETVFEIAGEELRRIADDAYAAKTLHVLKRAEEENPHIHLQLHDPA